MEVIRYEFKNPRREYVKDKIWALLFSGIFGSAAIYLFIFSNRNATMAGLMAFGCFITSLSAVFSDLQVQYVLDKNYLTIGYYSNKTYCFDLTNSTLILANTRFGPAYYLRNQKKRVSLNHFVPNFKDLVEKISEIAEVIDKR